MPSLPPFGRTHLSIALALLASRTTEHKNQRSSELSIGLSRVFSTPDAVFHNEGHPPQNESIPILTAGLVIKLIPVFISAMRSCRLPAGETAAGGSSGLTSPSALWSDSLRR